MIRQVTTDNLSPHPMEKITDENGELQYHWNNWLITLRDQVLGKNNVSSAQILKNGAKLSLPSSLIRVKSADGNITLGNPQILAGFDGQHIRLEGLNNTDKITLTNGTGLSLENGVPFELKEHSKIEFHYNTEYQLWIESNRRI